MTVKEARAKVARLTREHAIAKREERRTFNAEWKGVRWSKPFDLNGHWIGRCPKKTEAHRIAWERHRDLNIALYAAKDELKALIQQGEAA